MVASPLSVCTLQSRQLQYSCEVRSVPLNNPHRYPVVFTVRVTQSIIPPECAAPRLDAPRPSLRDPIIVTLTYFHPTGGMAAPR